MSNHTPTPWKIGLVSEISIVGRSGLEIAATVGDYDQEFERMAADAAHIVKCVNAHDELVAFLKRIVTESPCLAEIEHVAGQLLAKVQS